jgi:N-acetylglucosaminylphosphatidylinositol deacetylase
VIVTGHERKISFATRETEGSPSIEKYQFCMLSVTLRCSGRVLLVIAHPDDEAMFFSPVLAYLRQEGHAVDLLCISSGTRSGAPPGAPSHHPAGNYYGLGELRKRELRASCAVFGIQECRVEEQPGLEDGPHEWDAVAVARLVLDQLRRREYSTVRHRTAIVHTNERARAVSGTDTYRDAKGV